MIRSTETAYLNGQYLPLSEARVPVEDRGFMLADGVYEVVRYYAGHPFEMQAHLDRLDYSLDQLRIRLPGGAEPFAEISDQLMRRNALEDGSIYWQVTRGVAARQHPFPTEPVDPTVLAIAYAEPPITLAGPPKAMRAIIHEDIRWPRCAIKSISLLGNVLARQAAVDSHCDEAIMVRHGVVTEGTARSILIVYGGRIKTHPLDGRILGSITRQFVLDAARVEGIAVNENYFHVRDLLDADEVIALGTTTEVAAITQVDGHPIADGKPGPMCVELLELYRRGVTQACSIKA